MKRRAAAAAPAPAPKEAHAGLRERAETHIRERDAGAAPRRTGGETARLLHELEVHEIELTMQNAELRETRDALEESLERYTDLYDLAPVGYFSLDASGAILDVNLRGASKLGVARPDLIGRRFHRYVLPDGVAAFKVFLARVFDLPDRQMTEIPVRDESGAVFWADVHATAASELRDGRRWCRMVVSDITALKRAEEAQTRLEEMVAANRGLLLEIEARKDAERSVAAGARHVTQLLEESRRMHAQLRRLSRGMLHAQEQERKRISRELHDQIGQAVLGIDVHLDALSKSVQGASAGVRRRIEASRKMLRDFVDVVHRFSGELRPAVLDDLGLVPALRSYAKEFTERTGVEVRFTPGAASARLSSTKSTTLYRVAQEALTNVAKHAHATVVDLGLHEERGVVCLVVADDGRAFDVERKLEPTKRRRLGLLGMRERVEMVGGRFSVESAPGLGTCVRAEVPVWRTRTTSDAPAAPGGEAPSARKPGVRDSADRRTVTTRRAAARQAAKSSEGDARGRRSRRGRAASISAAAHPPRP